jgi:hypothetical protein
MLHACDSFEILNYGTKQGLSLQGENKAAEVNFQWHVHLISLGN